MVCVLFNAITFNLNYSKQNVWYLHRIKQVTAEREKAAEQEVENQPGSGSKQASSKKVLLISGLVGKFLQNMVSTVA